MSTDYPIGERIPPGEITREDVAKFVEAMTTYDIPEPPPPVMTVHMPVYADRLHIIEPLYTKPRKTRLGDYGIGAKVPGKFKKRK